MKYTKFIYICIYMIYNIFFMYIYKGESEHLNEDDRSGERFHKQLSAMWVSQP